MSVASLPLRWTLSMGEGVKVAVIEDSDMIAHLAHLFLVELGGMQAVVVESDFHQCLQHSFWEFHKPTAALIDYNLGGSITGDQIATFLKAEFPEIRRVKWTASQVLQHGPDPTDLYHYIVSKPFHPDTLLEALRG